MIIDLGVTDYEETYRIQREFVRRRKLGEIGDSVILTEHFPVFTIGRTGSEENLLVKKEDLKSGGIKVLRVDRGGDITFHGPGQLVIYPIIDLKNRDKDLHSYMRDAEETVIRFLRRYSISSGRINGKTGVWVSAEKIASIGIAASDWITYHGISININADLNFFSMINPCGMPGIKVTSLAKILGRNIAMDDLKAEAVSSFKAVFGIDNAEFSNHRHAAMA
jgi:lipoate-protein ligase B